jgi:hypothetical protein
MIPSIKKFNEFISESHEEEWIDDAVKKPGALRRHFHKKEGEKITKTEINDEIAELIKKDMNKEKPGAQLGKRDATLYKRLNLAKNLMDMNEDHNESENYMFFANISNIKRMCDEMLEMEPSMVDSILTDGHGWAVDHIATSKDDVEEVYNFLKSTSELSHGAKNGLISDDNNN